MTGVFQSSNSEQCKTLAWVFGALGIYWIELIYQLGTQWSAYEQYNYGWLVPLLCAYLLWKRLQSSEIIEPKTGVRWGAAHFVWLFGVLALLWFVTRWLHEANPIWRLTSWLLALEVVALTLLVIRFTFGASRFQLSTFAFPIVFFLVAVPWPSGLEMLMTQTLMRADVSVTTELLTAVGIPALPSGNVIEIATGLVGVDEACSGIRSFQATLMISLFLGELYRLTIRRRIILSCAGWLLAFVFNVGRTFLLVDVASRKGLAAMAQWHDPAGVTILVGCFFLIWLLALALRKSVMKQPAVGLASRRRLSLLPVSGLVPLIFGLIGWFIFTESGIEWWYRSHESRAAAAQSWTVRWPVDQLSFKQVELSVRTKQMLSFESGGQCSWVEPDGSFWQMAYFRWEPSRSLYVRVRSQLNKGHRPEHCLTGVGMKQVGDLGVGTYLCDNVPFSLRKYLFEADGRLLRVFFAQYEDSAKPEFLASYRENTAQRVAAALSGSRNYGLRILEIVVAGNLDESQANAALQIQLKKIIQFESVGATP